MNMMGMDNRALRLLPFAFDGKEVTNIITKLIFAEVRLDFRKREFMKKTIEQEKRRLENQYKFAAYTKCEYTIGAWNVDEDLEKLYIPTNKK